LVELDGKTFDLLLQVEKNLIGLFCGHGFRQDFDLESQSSILCL